MTREKGELVDWLDNRGFGFIQRPGGAGKLYVHMKSIGKSVDRPKPGDLLEYTVQPGKDGRPVAIDVIILTAPPKPPQAPVQHEHHTVLGVGTRVVGAAVILALLSANIFGGRLPSWVAALYLIAGVGSFLLYRGDKQASVDGGWRKPELRLHLVDLTFGIVGGLFAQHVFRHKTYKPSFVTETALITVVHVLLLGFILFGVYAPGSIGEFVRQFHLPG
ncbi:MAG: DUF1294 domain-containing protein [Hyphomonadaceae bacterium]|nr:DUF1294 domain-containing protein [Hyphomonadaceae bacterium]